MASIVIDGPRQWALDVLDRKLSRAFSAVAGLVMLAAVFIIQPGPARFALAVGSVVLVARVAVTPRLVTHDDLAEIEAIVLDLRADVDHRTDVGMAGLRELNEGLTIICDRLDR